MKLLNPREIGASIIQLVREADEYFIIVTAYLNIFEWDELTEEIESAIRRGVAIHLYFRESNHPKDLNFLSSVGVKLNHIPQLHAKFYLNEKSAVVTSMNLIKYSSLNSVDISTIINDPQEHKQLFEFFENEIESLVDDLNKKKQTERSNDLHRLRSVLARKYPDRSLKMTYGYIYTTNLIPNFISFIFLDAVVIKYPPRRWDEAKKQEIERMLKLIVEGKYELTDLTDRNPRWRIRNIDDMPAFLAWFRSQLSEYYLQIEG